MMTEHQQLARTTLRWFATYQLDGQHEHDEPVLGTTQLDARGRLRRRLRKQGYTGEVLRTALRTLTLQPRQDSQHGHDSTTRPATDAAGDSKTVGIARRRNQPGLHDAARPSVRRSRR